MHFSASTFIYKYATYLHQFSVVEYKNAENALFVHYIWCIFSRIVKKNGSEIAPSYGDFLTSALKAKNK